MSSKNPYYSNKTQIKHKERKKERKKGRKDEEEEEDPGEEIGSTLSHCLRTYVKNMFRNTSWYPMELTDVVQSSLAFVRSICVH